MNSANDENAYSLVAVDEETIPRKDNTTNQYFGMKMTNDEP